MTTFTPSTFTFRSQDLLDHLGQASQQMLTGYWLLQPEVSTAAPPLSPWYLALAQGRVIFSGQQLSWESLLAVLYRFIPRLREDRSQAVIRRLTQEYTSEQRALLGNMLARMQKEDLLSHQDGVRAVRLGILTDLDRCLNLPAGTAQFVPDFRLIACSPVLGFQLSTLLQEVSTRQRQWQEIRAWLPANTVIPKVDPEGLLRSRLRQDQRQQLHQLTQTGQSLEQIAESLGKDLLEVGRTFANLARAGVIRIEGGDGSGDPASANGSTAPKIWIVDDSVLLLKQFQTLVHRWGYQVICDPDPVLAVERMVDQEPDAIFLDINMPGASGFELIKQIRRQPQLSSVPLVLLTGERTLSNQWRAQWAQCRFLCKPRTAEQIPEFRLELRSLLREIAPLRTDTLV